MKSWKNLENLNQILLRSLLLLIICLPLFACQQNAITSAMTTTTNTTPSITPTPIIILLTQDHSLPTPSESPRPTTPTTKPGILPASPLDGVELGDLSSYITNKFSPPLPGSDNPHQGVDFSIVDRETQLAIGGDPVHAVLDGVVASVIQNRFPYGNAILVETNIESLSGSIINSIVFPTPETVELGHPILTCPIIDDSSMSNLRKDNDNSRSLYILYAHLDESPHFQQEDKIAVGQTIGRIGMSGNALNPHLHLELRVGLSGFRIPSMAHYHPSASVEEMGYYCLWRISNAFQLLDPMILLEYPP